jgi:drug/metabolite transporter (DMT)-like permease
LYRAKADDSAVNDARGAWGWLNRQPYLLLSLTSLFWAGNIVLGRFVAGHVPPVALTWFRWGVACLIVLPFAWPHLKRDWPAVRRHVPILTALALTGSALYHAGTYTGLQYTVAINVLLLQSAGPLMVAVWTWMLFGDRLTAAQAAGIATSLAGVLVIVSGGDPAVLLGIGFNRGDLYVLGALVLYTLYTALLRKRPAMHPLSFLAVTMGWGAILLTPLLLAEMASGRVIAFDRTTLLTLSYVCVFPSLIGYLFLNRGVELIGANRAAPFLHLVPVFGSVLAVTLLGERFQLFHAAGYALVIAGVAAAARSGAKV